MLGCFRAAHFPDHIDQSSIPTNRVSSGGSRVGSGSGENAAEAGKRCSTWNNLVQRHYSLTRCSTWNNLPAHRNSGVPRGTIWAV